MPPALPINAYRDATERADVVRLAESVQKLAHTLACNTFDSDYVGALAALACVKDQIESLEPKLVAFAIHEIRG